MLVVVYNTGQGHSRDGEDKNSDENLVGLEGGSGDRDHEADPRCRRVELADHDADKSATHRQAQTGQNEWHGRWKHDRLKDLPIRSPKASCSGKEIVRCRLHSVTSVDQQGKEGAKENDTDLGDNADPEPNNDERQESNPWGRVHGVNKWVANVGESLVPTDGDPNRDGDNNGKQVSPEKFDATDVQVVIDLPEANI